MFAEMYSGGVFPVCEMRLAVPMVGNEDERRSVSIYGLISRAGDCNTLKLRST